MRGKVIGLHGGALVEHSHEATAERQAQQASVACEKAIDGRHRVQGKSRLASDPLRVWVCGCVGVWVCGCVCLKPSQVKASGAMPSQVKPGDGHAKPSQSKSSEVR